MRRLRLSRSHQSIELLGPISLKMSFVFSISGACETCCRNASLFRSRTDRISSVTVHGISIAGGPSGM